MLAALGELSVLVALSGSALLAVAAVRVTRGRARGDLMRPTKLLVGGAVMAMATLEAAIIFDDFTVAYVANHHSVTTPFPFNIATAWAALEGSIVLWGLVLAGFTWIVARDHQLRRDKLGSGAVAVMAIVGIFFFGLMATVANPFETCIEAGARSCLTSSPIPFLGAEAPLDGRGPNPLLQNHILMAIHPPLLYLGYVGLTVPFAYGMSALAITRPGGEWLARSKRWTLVAWIFLSLGILLGGWWAYEVLSWGGYWAWDPVENASLLPWLIATAFLHSAIVQQRRGMLQAWNFILVIGAFALTILGTFLTRSGTVASVHSFTQSAIGPALLAFLLLIVVGSLGLFAMRAHLVAQPSRLEALSSREGAFLANNLLLVTYAIIVLVGTIYPIVLEAFSGDRVQVGGPFYNRLAVPLTFGLLLAMGIGPVMPWRVASPRLVWERIHTPLQVGLLAGAVTVLTVSTVPWVVLAVVTATFVIGVSVAHMWRAAGDRASAKGTERRAEITGLFRRDPGFWGGQVSHAGVVMVAVGIAFASNLAVHNEVRMEPGDLVSFWGYELTYTTPFLVTEPNRTVTGVELDVSRDGRSVTTLQPRLNQFEASTFAIGSPAVYTTWRGDLYVTLIDVGPDDAVIQLDSSPLQWMLWLGGLVTVGGGVIALKGRARDRSRDREKSRV